MGLSIFLVPFLGLGGEHIYTPISAYNGLDTSFTVKFDLNT